MKVTFVLVLISASLAAGQRPFFAGSKPIGYPIVTTTEGLVDRFGEIDGTTQRLPIEANGDRDLVDRLSKLPLDKQPFWFINWQALEANRQKPQTYPQKPNPFIEPSSGSPNFNSANANSNFENSNAESSATANTENRFGTNTDLDSKFENVHSSANSNSGIENSNFENSSTDKKKPVKYNKVYHA